jgi:hypothetical protein
VEGLHGRRHMAQPRREVLGAREVQAGKRGMVELLTLTRIFGVAHGEGEEAPA